MQKIQTLVGRQELDLAFELILVKCFKFGGEFSAKIQTLGI